MASPLFATPYAGTHSPTASIGSKRKRDFGDEIGIGNSPRGMTQSGSGRTMKRCRNGRPREEEVYQYTLQKLFSAQSQGLQPSPPPPPLPTAHQTTQLAQLQSRPHPAAASPALKNACSTRGLSLPRAANANPFAAMGHTKPTAGAGLLKFMCNAGAASAHLSIGHVSGITMGGMGEVVACDDCDRRMEIAGFGGDEEGRCVGCARRVCEVGCSIERVEGIRVCLECAMKGY